MQKDELPPRIKKAMRSLVGLAREVELKRALEEVHADFQNWKVGGINSFELSDHVHKLHDGPNREIYLRYTSRLDPRSLIRYALEEKLIHEADVSEEIRPYLALLTS